MPSSDATRDELWLIIKRYINGKTVRHIEVMQKVWESGDTQSSAFFADCGGSITNATATDTVTGINWAEGETFGVYVDGASHPDCVVTNGTITLDNSYTVVTYGYKYNSDGTTMPSKGGAQDGSAQGKKKIIHRLGFWLFETLGLKFGDSFTNLGEILEAQYGDDYGSPPSLYTGVHREEFEGGYDLLGQVYWRADGMFPATVLAVMPQLDVSDDS